MKLKITASPIKMLNVFFYIVTARFFSFQLWRQVTALKLLVIVTGIMTNMIFVTGI